MRKIINFRTFISKTLKNAESVVIACFGKDWRTGLQRNP